MKTSLPRHRTKAKQRALQRQSGHSKQGERRARTPLSRDGIPLDALSTRIAGCRETLETMASLAKALQKQLLPEGIPLHTQGATEARPLSLLCRDPELFLSPWLLPLLLESPAMRRTLRVRLIRTVTSHGVWRDLADLPDAGGFLPAVLILQTQMYDPQLLGMLSVALDSLLSGPNACPATPGDAVLLASWLSGKELEWVFSQLSCLETNGVRDLARWLSVGFGNHLSQPACCPASDLAAEFFRRKAFRGLRRHWARSRGRAAGKAGHCSIDPWAMPTLMPGKNGPAEAQAALLAEWYIGVQRGWLEAPEFRRVAASLEKAEELHSEVTTALAGAEGREAFVEWISSAFKEFRRAFSKPVGEVIGPSAFLGPHHPGGKS